MRKVSNEELEAMIKRISFMLKMARDRNDSSLIQYYSGIAMALGWLRGDASKESVLYDWSDFV